MTTYQAKPYGADEWMLAVDTSTSSMTTVLSRGGLWYGDITTCAERNHSLYLIPTLQRLLEDCKVKPAELGAFAVGVGPGSYTGTRIGVTVAKTFAWTHGLALIPVSTLEAMALGGLRDDLTGKKSEEVEQVSLKSNGAPLDSMAFLLARAQETGQTTWVVPMIEARRGQAYTAVYEASPAGWSCIAPDGIRLMNAWMDVLADKANERRPSRILFIGEIELHGEAIAKLATLWNGNVESKTGRLHGVDVAELGRMRWERGEAEKNVHELVPNYTQLAEAEAKLLAKRS